MFWLTLLEVLPALFLYAGRAAGVVITTPGLGQSAQVPPQIKVGIVFLLALVMVGAMGPGKWAGADPWLVAMALPLEFVVGLMLGFCVRFLFAIVEVAGEFMAFQMGFAAAATFDPTLGAVSSPPTRLLFMVSLMIFFAIDGHHQVIIALVDSYSAVGAGGASLDVLNAESFLELTYGLFRSGVRIAFPLIVVMLMINLVLGLIVRFLPQVNVFMIGFILTIGFGMLVLGELMPSYGALLEGLLGSVSEILPKMLRR